MTIDVLNCARFVCERSINVAIEEEAVPQFARKLLPMPIPAWDFTHHFYDGTARTVSYLLLVDALNFCFFPEPRWEVVVDGERLHGYFALTSALKQAFERDDPIDDFSHLAEVEEEEVRDLLHGDVPMGKIPLFEERVGILREVGERMTSLYHGDAAKLVRKVNKSAQRLVELVVESFPSFRDEACYAGEQITFHKRAQIFAGDLYGSFGPRSFGAFHDVSRLTAFADYKLPQILRSEGILRYCEELAARIDHKEWIEAGSSYEVEIRAATVLAVDLLRQELVRQGRNLLAIEVDWLLWHAAQRCDIPSHHRTLTTFY